QPEPVGVDDIALAVLRNVTNVTVPGNTYLLLRRSSRLASQAIPRRGIPHAASPYPGWLNEDSTSHRSIASSLYPLKYGRDASFGAATPWTIARYRRTGRSNDEPQN